MVEAGAAHIAVGRVGVIEGREKAVFSHNPLVINHVSTQPVVDQLLKHRSQLVSFQSQIVNARRSPDHLQRDAILTGQTHLTHASRRFELNQSHLVISFKVDNDGSDCPIQALFTNGVAGDRSRVHEIFRADRYPVRHTALQDGHTPL